MPLPFIMLWLSAKTPQPAVLYQDVVYVDADRHDLDLPHTGWSRTPRAVVVDWLVQLSVKPLTGHLLDTIRLHGYLDVTLPVVSATTCQAVTASPSRAKGRDRVDPRLASYARRFPHMVKSLDPLTIYTPDDGEIYSQALARSRASRSGVRE